MLKDRFLSELKALGQVSKGSWFPGGLEESALGSSVLVSQQTTGPMVEKGGRRSPRFKVLL